MLKRYSSRRSDNRALTALVPLEQTAGVARELRQLLVVERFLVRELLLGDELASLGVLLDALDHRVDGAL